MKEFEARQWYNVVCALERSLWRSLVGEQFGEGARVEARSPVGEQIF